MGAGKCGLGGRERGIRALKMGHIYMLTEESMGGGGEC